MMWLSHRSRTNRPGLVFLLLCSQAEGKLRRRRRQISFFYFSLLFIMQMIFAGYVDMNMNYQERKE